MYVLYMRGADDLGVSVLASCHLCSTAVLYVAEHRLLSLTTSQRQGTDNTAAIAVFTANVRVTIYYHPLHAISRYFSQRQGDVVSLHLRTDER